MKITTTHGPMEDADLEYRHGELDNDNECTTWDEYWLKGVCVHRSVAIQLKTPMISTAAIGAF